MVIYDMAVGNNVLDECLIIQPYGQVKGVGINLPYFWTFGWVPLAIL